MNPIPISWTVGALFLTAAVCGGMGYSQGYSDGVDKQMLVTDKQAAKFNKQIADQTVDAARINKEADAKVKESLEENDKLKTLIGEQDEKLRQFDYKLAAESRNHRLYITANCGGSGQSSGSKLPGTPNPSPDGTSTVVELNSALTRNLQQWAEDEQQVHRDYEKCRKFNYPKE